MRHEASRKQVAKVIEEMNISTHVAPKQSRLNAAGILQ
jgi:hypothetical protein